MCVKHLWGLTIGLDCPWPMYGRGVKYQKQHLSQRADMCPCGPLSLKEGQSSKDLGEIELSPRKLSCERSRNVSSEDTWKGLRHGLGKNLTNYITRVSSCYLVIGLGLRLRRRQVNGWVSQGEAEGMSSQGAKGEPQLEATGWCPGSPCGKR